MGHVKPGGSTGPNLIRTRPARLPHDVEAIAALDISFDTDVIFAARFDDGRISLEEVRLDAPITKSFPLNDLHDPIMPWTIGLVAIDENERVIGFVAAEFRAWNRRLVLWHLYVDRQFRGKGVARSLVDAVQANAERAGALHIWLETSNLNVPGVKAYGQMGFHLSGLDTTLYDGTSAEGEFALFLSRAVKASG
jgi:ribosomal protein S18 acetylase RimI-like enzyme